jgi:capsular exopolysaccharide synthesis family protein
MGKITSALQKAAEERLDRLEKINRIREQNTLVVRKAGESAVDARIMTYHDPKALISEQYKILRTNVLSLANKGKAVKTIVITSSIHSEGKTITALNLAIAMAQAVREPKVLLVDADMRKGKMAKYLGVKPENGLSDILKGKAKVEEAMFNLDGMTNLAFIASGAVPENPSELLESDAMKRFLSEMKSQFDYILLDVPPIISVTDAGIVGPQADGVLMVIQAGRTQRGIIRRAEELLFQSHCQVLGHVLTSIEYHLPEYIYRYL